MSTRQTTRGRLDAAGDRTPMTAPHAADFGVVPFDLPARIEPDRQAVYGLGPRMDLARDLAAARAAAAERVAAAAPIPQTDVLWRDLSVPGAAGDPVVLVRHYRPAGAAGATAALLWVHGGGHVMGSIEIDHPNMVGLVREVGCSVVAAEWRQAPEHPFPAAHDDCFAALRWMLDHAEELGIDASRYGIGGGSSGGGVAAGIALRARDEHLPPASILLLVNPMLDDRNDSLTAQAGKVEGTWNHESNAFGWRAYLGGATEPPPYAVPGRHLDLGGLPPTLIGIGDIDMFLQESLDFASRLSAAGTPVELHVYPGALHGWSSMPGDSARKAQFLRDRDEALRQAFAAR